MNEEIRTKLNEEISSELSDLANFASGSDEQQTAIENIVKLYKIGIEEEKVDADYDEKYNRREMDNKKHEKEFELREKEFELKKQECERQLRVSEHEMEKHEKEFELREKEFELKKQECERQLRVSEHEMEKHEKEFEIREKELDLKEQELDRQLRVFEHDTMKHVREFELRERELDLKERELVRQECENNRKEENMAIDRYIKLGVDIAGLVLPLMFYATWMKKGLAFEETGTFTSTTFRGLFNRFRPTSK